MRKFFAYCGWLHSFGGGSLRCHYPFITCRTNGLKFVSFKDHCCIHYLYCSLVINVSLLFYRSVFLYIFLSIQLIAIAIIFLYYLVSLSFCTLFSFIVKIWVCRCASSLRIVDGCIVLEVDL